MLTSAGSITGRGSERLQAAASDNDNSKAASNARGGSDGSEHKEHVRGTQTTGGTAGRVCGPYGGLSPLRVLFSPSEKSLTEKDLARASVNRASVSNENRARSEQG